MKEQVQLLTCAHAVETPRAPCSHLTCWPPPRCAAPPSSGHRKPTSQHRKQHGYRLAHRRTFPPPPPRGSRRAQPSQPTNHSLHHSTPQSTEPTVLPMDCAHTSLPSLMTPMTMARGGDRRQRTLARALQTACTCGKTATPPHTSASAGRLSSCLASRGAGRAQPATHC